MSTLSRPIFGALAQNFWTTARGASLALAAAVFPDMGRSSVATAGRLRPRFAWLACACLACAWSGCGEEESGYSEARCNDIRDQTMTALQQSVEQGVLVDTAVPCGDEGVANRADSFDSRVPAEDIEYLQGAFWHACREFEEHCAGVL